MVFITDFGKGGKLINEDFSLRNFNKEPCHMDASKDTLPTQYNFSPNGMMISFSVLPPHQNENPANKYFTLPIYIINKFNLEHTQNIY